MMINTPLGRRCGAATLYSPLQFFDALEKNIAPGNATKYFRTDIQDMGEHYVMEADLPGFRKEDIEIKLDDDVLSITAQRNVPQKDEEATVSFVRRERSFGSYVRKFQLEGVNADGIKVSYEDGVLKLVLPKSAPPAPTARRLEIE